MSPPQDDGDDGREAARRGAIGTSRDRSDEEVLIDTLVSRFLEEYQDPRGVLPYDDDDGRHVFVDGGPYDASEVLTAQFGRDAPMATIAAAVRRLEQDGVTEWTPAPEHDDYTGPYDDVVTHEGRVVMNDGRVVRNGSGASDIRAPSEGGDPVPSSPAHQHTFMVPSDREEKPGVVEVNQTITFTDADRVPDDDAVSSEVAEVPRTARDAASRGQAPAPADIGRARQSLMDRPKEIAACLAMLQKLLDERMADLEQHKPNAPAALNGWDDWKAFIADLRGALEQLETAVEAVTSGDVSLDEGAVKVQSTFDVYKSKLAIWPRENAVEVVDGTYRLSLIGACTLVGTLLGQPIGATLIGAAIFGGHKIGKAVSEAMRSGGSPS